MTAINFPAAPATGATHTEAGITWTFDGTVWDSKVADTFVNTTGDVMTGNLTVPSLNGGQLAGFRNQIINGAFQVWQRGVHFPVATAAGNYTADRWCRQSNPGSDVVQEAISGNADFAYGIRAKGTAIKQGIELPAPGKRGPFYGKWTLSVYTTDPNPQFRLLFADNVDTGTNGVTAAAVTPLTATSDPVQAGVLKRYSVTFDITAAPAATNVCLIVHSAAITDYVYTGIQFEQGTVATPFEHRPIGVELALCQRYFQAFIPAGFVSVKAGVGLHGWYAPLVPQMRVKPSVLVKSGNIHSLDGTKRGDVNPNQNISSTAPTNSSSVGAMYLEGGLTYTGTYNTAGELLHFSGMVVDLSAEL